jgi:hypothetical protein
MIEITLPSSVFENSYIVGAMRLVLLILIWIALPATAAITFHGRRGLLCKNVVSRLINPHAYSQLEILIETPRFYLVKLKYSDSVYVYDKENGTPLDERIEITDLNNLYLKDGKLEVAFVQGKWLDTGTFEALYQATEFVREKEMKQGAVTPVATTNAASVPVTPVVVPAVSTESKPSIQIPSVEVPVTSVPAGTPTTPSTAGSTSTSPDLEIPPEIASMLSATPGAQ